MANESPPWAAIRALNAKRGVALDKVPGTRPVHVGEVFMRALGKDLLVTARDDAKEACGSAQLCAGLEAGIEGGIHVVKEAWEEEGWEHDFAPAPSNPFTPYVEAAEKESEHFDVDELMEMEKELPEISAKGMALFDARNGFNELKRYQRCCGMCGICGRRGAGLHLIATGISTWSLWGVGMMSQLM